MKEKELEWRIDDPKKIYEQVNKLFDPIISDNKSFL